MGLDDDGRGLFETDIDPALKRGPKIATTNAAGHEPADPENSTGEHPEALRLPPDFQHREPSTKQFQGESELQEDPTARTNSLPDGQDRDQANDPTGEPESPDTTETEGLRRKGDFCTITELIASDEGGSGLDLLDQAFTRLYANVYQLPVHQPVGEECVSDDGQR
ncbi:hypothetical protein EX30DRAFT_378748 [Ascodesmis nigricans]|uniref:Uncharacterized protein n=1 Tax=Ascodesmis nigricans TaxID=341454 RepID=A0A4S2MH17_9PEZI|nr:hypothetical protein EX30DRAFT_378748 [Ascodesmis nigricans]